MNLEFKYAVIDLNTNQCWNICTYSKPVNRDDYIPIEVLDFGYMDKYYLNGAWYEDAAGTIPWSPEE